ncbi:MAG: T9SS type A sorting domain-containing protein [Phaeodactylibacter sp.]|nr:T9SS type A sorting domain-containing protein [Phaeodactylibacter sp.]
MKNHVLFLLLISGALATTAQVSDFTMTDINGNSHSLYADYLDQGKPVLISVSAAWGFWDSIWVSSGVLDDFQAQYGNDAGVLFIEGDPGTPEGDLYGTGSSGTFDFVTGHDYVIMDDPTGIMQNEFGLYYFPCIFMICPDGTGYTSNPGTAPGLIDDPDVFYGNFQFAEDIVDKFYQHCGTTFDRSKLNGLVYHDLNIDCDQSGEAGLPGVMASITGPTGSLFRISDANGEFRMLADEGTYTVEVLPPSAFWDVCDGVQSHTFGSTQDSIYLDFGLQANMPCYEPTVEISAPFLVRCFESSIHVKYCNSGTIPAEDVVVTVTLDEFLLVDAISQTPSSQNGLTYTFDIGTLGVFECGDIVFDITVSCDAELGTEQCYAAEISPEPDCIQTLAAELEECQEIVGSFDPNDKRAYPFQEGDDYTVGPNETMRYQVRFQNTGTFTAFNVVVLDTISPLLDLSTFRMGTASHDYEVSIVDERTLRVAFPDINLPDSTSNEPASHGFFTYYIDQMPDLPDGALFTNTAGIYFDFNDPVITNTTRHTVDYGVVSAPRLDLQQLQLSVAPNPVEDLLRVSIEGLSTTSGRYDIHTIDGRRLRSGQFAAASFEVSVGTLPPGLYFLQVTDDVGNRGVEKVIVR